MSVLCRGRSGSKWRQPGDLHRRPAEVPLLGRLHERNDSSSGGLPYPRLAIRIRRWQMADKQDSLASRGLTLSRRVLRRLNEVGVFAQSQVSLEHQHLAKRYVVRGIESGGAVKDLGRYVTFCVPAGEALPYLHPIDAIGVNGVHAVVVAAILVRIELFRTSRTCQLLITKHEPGKVENGRRPPLENRVLFRGVNGFLDGEPIGKEDHLPISAMPRFWSRSGEHREIPPVFATVVCGATIGATCVGRSHAHCLVAPLAVGISSGSV